MCACARLCLRRKLIYVASGLFFLSPLVRISKGMHLKQLRRRV